MAKPKRGLGKGLEALFVDNNTADLAISTLSISEIEPNSGQPRREFSPEELSRLADSIRTHGVLQPLVVRPRPNGRYQIVAGERRWRAARIAGLTELPVVVREMTDAEAYEAALIENLIRADLNPVEEAMGYRTLMEQFQMTQEQVAARVGKSRPAVANSLRLLSLPPELLKMLEAGTLSSGHARALLPLGEGKAVDAARRVLSQGMSVRQTEELSKRLQKEEEAPQLPPRKAPTLYREMELALTEALSRRVRISPKGEGKGELLIEFYSHDELKDLGRRLTPGE